jgi:hypothetical protein
MLSSVLRSEGAGGLCACFQQIVDVTRAVDELKLANGDAFAGVDVSRQN